MAKILLNNDEIGCVQGDYQQIVETITQKTLLKPKEFYLVQNGRRIPSDNPNKSINAEQNVHCILRSCGGKGGFGSMLRAIGAQIEKTTNREACRDLSGRRLRDINEEKRLKAWLDKQADREREAEERKKRKIEKLLAVPKHEFKDEKYEEARSKLTEKVSDAVEEGFKKALEAKKDSNDVAKNHALKRKGAASTAPARKKPALWIGDDISDTDGSSSDSDDDDDVPGTSKQNKEKCVEKKDTDVSGSSSDDDPATSKEDKEKCVEKKVTNGSSNSSDDAPATSKEDKEKCVEKKDTDGSSSSNDAPATSKDKEKCIEKKDTDGSSSSNDAPATSKEDKEKCIEKKDTGESCGSTDVNDNVPTTSKQGTLNG